MIVSYLLTKAYDWEDIIPEETITELAKYLKVGIPLVLYFIFNQHFTFQYVGKLSTLVVSNMLLLEGPHALLFWEIIIVGFILPEILLFTPNIQKDRLFLASILTTLGLWVNCILIVVPALSFPNLPFNWGTYSPTWVEWSIIAGVTALGVLIFTVLTKLIPIVELE